MSAAAASPGQDGALNGRAGGKAQRGNISANSRARSRRRWAPARKASTKRSASVDTLLHFLIDELRPSARLTTQIPDDPRKLRGKLADLLADCGKKGKTVVVIDALDQLESGLSDLDWLPLALPEGVKLVVSFKRGEPRAHELESSWRVGKRVRVQEHRGFYQRINLARKHTRCYAWVRRDGAPQMGAALLHPNALPAKRKDSPR